MFAVVFVNTDLAPFVSSTEILPLRYQLADTPKKEPNAQPQPSFLGRLLGRTASPNPRGSAPSSPAQGESVNDGTSP